MLRVTITLVRSALESGKRTLVVAEIRNIGGAELADYSVKVGDEALALEKPRVPQYPRSPISVRDLVPRAMAQAMYGQEQLPTRPTPVFELVPVRNDGMTHTRMCATVAYLIQRALSFVSPTKESGTPGSGHVFRVTGLTPEEAADILKPSTAIAHIKSALAYRRVNVSLQSVLVIDVEATTGADREPGALRDIIQVGACLLRMGTGVVEHADSVLVRPTCSEVTPFCTELTGITSQMAKDGLTFIDACEWMKTKYDSERTVWASYGNYDRQQFVVQCEREGLRYPLSHDHLNVKLVVALHAGWPKAKGLTRALAAMTMSHEGRHHDAKFDAINAARLLHRALRPAVPTSG